MVMRVMFQAHPPVPISSEEAELDRTGTGHDVTFRIARDFGCRAVIAAALEGSL